MHRILYISSLLFFSLQFLMISSSRTIAGVVVTFDELAVFNDEGSGPTNRYYNGNGFGANSVGWSSQGASFNTAQYGPGWSYSNLNNTTTPGFGNLFASYTGSGFGGSGNYAVAYGFRDLLPSMFDTRTFNPLTATDLRSLPSIGLPSGMQASNVRVTNSTFAALSMLNGDGFAKRFGGPSESDPDFLKLSVFGIGAANNPLGVAVDFYLADYRSINNVNDYVVNSWQLLDLSALANARSLHFNLSSSDVGNFGMNTPGSFAIDNLQLTAVPEPSTLALVGLVTSVFAFRRYRTKRAKVRN